MKLSFWDILASMVMLGGLALATIFINIFVNPYSFINPFPPPTPVASLQVPTLTPSQRSLPELWTSTPETPGVPSVTAVFTTPTITLTGTHLVLPTGTVTSTRTASPSPSKSITNTPNRTLTAIAYKTATKTATGGSTSEDTISPTTPGRPLCVSPCSSTDPTPSWTWTASTDSGGSGFKRYEITWGTDSGGDNTIYTSTSNSWTAPVMTTSLRHYIFVRAVDNAGNQSPWTTANSFIYTLGASAPTVVTNAASGVGTTTATINGTVTANSSTTTVFFQIGSTTSYGTNLVLGTTLSGTVATSVSVSLTGLTPNHLYHFRTGAYNSVGTSYGGDLTFTTSDLPASTTSITGDAPDPSDRNSAYTVSVTVTGTGTPTGTVSVSDGTGGTCTITLAGGSGSCSLTSTTAGAKTITATYSGDGSNAASSDTESHTVNRTDPTITFTLIPTPTYLGGNFTVGASTTNTDSSTLTYSVVSGPCTHVSGATFASTGAGDCEVRASGAQTTNFNAATQDQTITIAKAQATITFSAPSATYGTDFDATASTNNSDDSTITFVVTGGDCTQVDADTFHPDAATTCDIQASGAGDSTNFLGASPVSRTVTIAKAASVITFPAPGTQIYDTDFDVSATTTNTDDPTITFSVTSGSCSAVDADTFHADAAGSCTIEASGAGATTNYLATSPVSRTVTISKADQTITFTTTPTSPVVVGDPAYSVAADASSGLAVVFSVTGACTLSGGDTVEFNNGTGTCTVRANQAGNANYNAAPQVTQSITVNSP